MKKLLLLGAVVCASVFGQSAQFPGSVATDAHLKRAVNNLETNLASPMAAGDTIITVRNATGIVSGMLLTVDREILSVTAVSGNNITVQRGFDGTAAVSHLSGRKVEALITAWHHNVLAAEIKALEAAVDTLDTGVSKNPATYDFGAQQPGGSLSVGSNVIAMSPCPLGVNGSNVDYRVHISGGTGTAENALVTGGTCTSGAASGTLIITAANAHSGAWTVRSSTAGLAEGWNVVRALRADPGTYTMYGTVTPPANSTLECGGRGRQHSGHTTFSLGATTLKAFNVVNRNFALLGCDLAGPGATATTGSIGIYTAGNGSGVSGAEANDALIRDVRVTGFRDGIYIDGSGGSVDLERVEASNNTRFGIGGYGAQGYWKTIISETNGSDGINLGLCVTVGSCGVGPFMSDVQTFNNQGWGIRSLTAIFLAGNNYLNNDYEGEIYQLLPIGDSVDNGYIRNVTLQFAGSTISWGTNNNAPGILIDSTSGPLAIHNVRLYDVKGIGIHIKSGRHSLSFITVVGAGTGAQSGHEYSLKTETATNVDIDNFVANAPVSMSGADNVAFLQSRVAVDSALPALRLVSGTNVKIDQSFLSNATGHAEQTDSGTTLLDGDNEIFGTVSLAHTPATLARKNNVWRRTLNGALPTIASATTIVPTAPMIKVSGTATIERIEPPVGFDGTELVIIPTGLWTMSGGADNIAASVIAVDKKPLVLYYNSTDGFWYPSY